MKCTFCKEGSLKKRKVTEIINIPGGPDIKILDVEKILCDKCEEEWISGEASDDRIKKVLSALVSHYQDHRLQGKAANYIRKAINLSLGELSKNIDKDPSTFSQAVKRNSEIDTFTKIYLLTQAVDFINGNQKATKKLMAAIKVDQNLDSEMLDNIEIDQDEVTAVGFK